MEPSHQVCEQCLSHWDISAALDFFSVSYFEDCVWVLGDFPVFFLAMRCFVSFCFVTQCPQLRMALNSFQPTMTLNFWSSISRVLGFQDVPLYLAYAVLGIKPMLCSSDWHVSQSFMWSLTLIRGFAVALTGLCMCVCVRACTCRCTYGGVVQNICTQGMTATIRHMDFELIESVVSEGWEHTLLPFAVLH